MTDAPNVVDDIQLKELEIAITAAPAEKTEA